MLLREAHFCQVQVSVGMMCVEGQHTPEETCCHFRIARGQIVISEIVQQSGRIGSNFQGAPVESFRRRVPLVGIKDHPHETQRTHIAWLVSQHRVQCCFGFSGPALLERPRGILVNGVRNLLLREDDKDRENRADRCENPNSHTRTATAGYAAEAPKGKMKRISLPFDVNFALPVEFQSHLHLTWRVGLASDFSEATRTNDCVRPAELRVIERVKRFQTIL